MKQADGWLVLSAFPADRLFLQTGFYISRQAFILEVEVSQVLPHTPRRGRSFKKEHLLRLNTEILVEFGDSGTIRILQILNELTFL